MNHLFIAMQAQQGSIMPTLLMIAAMIAIMYFFIMRPQQQRQKKIQAFRNKLAVGQEVVTSGGIYGKITYIDPNNNIVNLEIATGVRIRVDKSCLFANAEATQEGAK